MNFIFICSYLNVPCAIDTIEREGDEFRILSSNRNITKLFSDLYSPDVVMELPSLFTSFGNAKLFFGDLIQLFWHKHRYLKQCKKLSPDRVFFYYIGWNGFESWLIKKLSVDALVYYRPKVDLSSLKYNKTPKQRIKAIIARLLYSIPFQAMRFNEYPIIAIDKQFLELVKAKSYPEIIDPVVIRNFVKNRFVEYSRVEVLFLIGNELNIDEAEYNKTLRLLYKILEKYYEPEQIGIKLHPDCMDKDITWGGKCTIITRHLPANILCYKCSVIISYASASLYEAANLGKTAISLLYLVGTRKKGQIENYRKYLAENTKNKIIIYPKTLEDFEEVVQRVSNR